MRTRLTAGCEGRQTFLSISEIKKVLIKKQERPYTANHFAGRIK